MFGRLMPREGRFFELFNLHAEQVVAGARELVALFNELGTDPAAVKARAEAIDVIETRADKITHDCISLLHTTFITPIDRDDIHRLIGCMDDILDLMQDVAESVHLYDLRRATPEARQLAELCHSCADRVRAAVRLLDNMDHAQAIMKTCHEIDQLESDADRVFRSALGRVFREQSDGREVLKFKAVYELLEAVTDRCEDAANLIEGIVLENS
jgi:predicted phosphate transport protein (TIGR00153 family)